MVWVRLFLSAFLIFTILGCEKEDDISNESGGANTSCYSAKSEIYTADTESAEHRTASQSTVRFFDRGAEIVDFQAPVTEGKYIVLPDIRAKYCKNGNKGNILTGWDDGGTVTRPGQKYKVADADVAFDAVWEEGVEIYTAKHLYDMRDNLSGKYKLMRNIDLVGYGDWDPIGEELNPDPFTGKLYGNGYIIDNLTVDNGSRSAAGLFGAIGGKSAVYDLRIALSADGIKLSGVDRKKAAGALAGYIVLYPNDNVTVENVKTIGGGIQIGISNCVSYSEMYAGGIVGAIEINTPLDSPELSIINSSNGVDISAQTSADSRCSVYLGGIIGGNFYMSSDFSKITVSGNKNYGAVTSYIFSYLNIGGIAGSILNGDTESVEVDNCTNYGAITVASSSPSPQVDTVFAGGIAGKTDAKINRCVNRADILVENNHAIVSPYDPVFAAGGIIGDLSDTGMINESRNLADISASSDNSGQQPQIFAGGLSGRSHGSPGSPPNHAVIQYSVNNGEVRASIIDDNVSFRAAAGGVVGYAYNYADIFNSYNTDNVSAATNAVFSGATQYTYAGGIAGLLGNYTTVNYTYNNGNVSVYAGGGSMPYPDVVAGGIAGYLSGSNTSVDLNIQLDSDVTVSPLIPPNALKGWIIGDSLSPLSPVTNYSQRDTPSGEHGPYGSDGTFYSVPYAKTRYEALGFDFTDNWTFNTGTIPPTLQWEKE